MNRSCFIIWVLVFLVFQTTNAQTNFQKGYIIKAEFDTIYGEIDNKNYYENSRFCDFKDLETNSITRYYPEDLLGYRFIDGKYYISKKVEGNKIFMEYLIDGKLDIYFFRIPLSFNYIKPRPGISPFFAYEIDLNSFFATQAVKAGLMYPLNKVSFALTADVKTVTLVIPYSSSLNFGILFDLQR